MVRLRDVSAEGSSAERVTPSMESSEGVTGSGVVQEARVRADSSRKIKTPQHGRRTRCRRADKIKKLLTN